ncbi:MAG: hypothetical protein RIT35_313, partial [Pseudomonadota bacterium]
KYIGRKFIFDFSLISLIFAIIILLATILTNVKEFHNLKIITFTQIILFKLPYLLQEILPFIILLSGVCTFSKLSKSSELVVARAAGISVWQLIRPTLIISIMISIFNITIFNSLSAGLLNIQETLLNKYLHQSNNLVSVSNSGLWLIDNNNQDKSIINAKNISTSNMNLEDVTIMLMKKDNSFIKRIAAKTAIIKDNKLKLKDVIIYEPGKVSKRLQDYQLKTYLQFDKLQNNYSASETKSFWELPEFIKQLKTAGFSARRAILYYYNLILNPFTLSAMLLIAIPAGLKCTRVTKMSLRITLGVICGFVIYFFIELVATLALSGTIPLLLAASAPIFVSILIAIAILLHLEDG